MKLKYLLEIADKILPYNINLSDKEGVIGSFNSAGDRYKVHVIKNRDDEDKIVYEFGFFSSKGKQLSAKSRNQPELKNVFEVMATIKDIFRKYIEKFKPKYVSFFLFDNIKSRTNIYSKMLKLANYKKIYSENIDNLFKRT